jgi:hypothetical protein
MINATTAETTLYASAVTGVSIRRDRKGKGS